SSRSTRSLGTDVLFRVSRGARVGLALPPSIQHHLDQYDTGAVKTPGSFRRITFDLVAAATPVTPPPPGGLRSSERRCCRSARDFGTIRTSPAQKPPDRRYRIMSTMVSRP